MLATQLILLLNLVIMLVLRIRNRRAKNHLADYLANERATLMDHGAQIKDQAHNLECLRQGHHDLFKLLKTSVSVDVGGRHDCGWLIFIARVNGQDMVKIQHLKPQMTFQEYQDLVVRLSYDCQHVAYIDGPKHIEEWLRRPIEKLKRW